MSDDKIDGIIYANAFGGMFPVCSEEQKVRMEAAFNSAMDYGKSDENIQREKESAENPECTCDLIIRLLDGSANRSDMISLGASIAKDIYQGKSLAAALVMAMNALGKTASSEVPGRKEWLN